MKENIWESTREKILENHGDIEAIPEIPDHIKAGYKTLNYITFFTSGETETRAWTITKGTLAPQAAGEIHTDFEKGFIRAEVVAWDKLVEHGWVKCRELGLIRTEGKLYEIKDGDVIAVFHN